MTRTERNELVAAMTRDGHTATAIACELNISLSSVTRARQATGTAKAYAAQAERVDRAKREERIAALTKAGHTAAYISRELGIHERTVCRVRTRIRDRNTPRDRRAMTFVHNMDWTVDAACRPDPDWTTEQRPEPDVEARLRRVCCRCPVNVDCASWALASRAEMGVYAGVWLPTRVAYKCARTNPDRKSVV